MSTLRFNDDVTINMDGPLRITRKRDGLYVVGEGMCMPIDDREEGKQIIKELTEIKNKSNK